MQLNKQVLDAEKKVSLVPWGGRPLRRVNTLIFLCERLKGPELLKNFYREIYKMGKLINHFSCRNLNVDFDSLQLGKIKNIRS